MKYCLVIAIIVLLAAHCSADFGSDCVDAHNAYRTPLNIAALTWSSSLAESAQQWANYLAAQGTLEHSSSQYGENLAERSGTYSGSTTSSTTSSTGSTNNNAASINQSNNSGSVNGSGDSSAVNGENTIESSSEDNGQDNSQSDNQQSINNSNRQGDESDSEGNDGSDNAEENIQNNHGRWSHRGANNQNNNNNNYNNNRNDNNHHHHNRNGRYLASSSSGTSDIQKLIGLWGDEKKYFVYGTFPDVSNSGDWSDVGHYTQMIWADTKQVGCGIANGHGDEYLVCQYYPAGNMDGDTVY